MDVDHINHLLVHESNDTDLWVAYNRASGARFSAMEHLVPEQMFSTEDNPAHGISAVKAIQIAAAEGQKIWTITQANLSTALAAINLPSAVESDIRKSVYAGMEVTAHEQPVNFYGTSQVGYIVLDPETGAGGYLIGSGENGGILIAIGITMIIAELAIVGLALMGGVVLSTSLFLMLINPITMSGAAFHMVTVFSSAIALISRGAEVILRGTTDQDTACRIFQGAVANSVGGFLGQFKALVGLLSSLLTNHMSPFIVGCLK